MGRKKERLFATIPRVVKLIPREFLAEHGHTMRRKKQDQKTIKQALARRKLLCFNRTSKKTSFHVRGSWVFHQRLPGHFKGTFTFHKPGQVSTPVLLPTALNSESKDRRLFAVEVCGHMKAASCEASKRAA